MWEFWQAIGGFKARRKTRGRGIKKEDWKTHFMKLLDGEELQTVGSEFDHGVGGGGGEDTMVQPEESGEADKESSQFERRDDTGQGNEDELEDLNREISFKEVAKVVDKLKKGKAAGEDGVSIDFIKWLPEVWAREVHRILNGMWKEARLGRGWEKARIFPIHKGGEESVTGNYRGVALLNVGYKILAAILDERLRVWLERKGLYEESQGGFRRKRATRDHVWVLNSLINNKLKNKGGKLYVAFVDLKKAFDTVDRRILLEKLKKIGIEGRMLNMIGKIYGRTLNEVITGEGITECFVTSRGVRQGCPLSPTLFNIFIRDMDEAWEKRNIGGTVIGGTKIFGLKFADDVALVADWAEGLSEMLRSLEGYVERNKLEINADKTKVMVFRKGGRRKQAERWKVGGKDLEVVDKYKYLGFWFSTGGTYTKHVQKLAGKARTALNAAWGIMRRARINKLGKRLYLMDALVKAGGMYGVEIWGWERREAVEKVQGRFVKMAMGLDSTTPNYIWRMEAGRHSIEIEARKRAIGYLMRICGMSEDRWPKICLREELRGIINGNPTSWGKTFQEAGREVGDGETVRWLWEGGKEEVVESNLLRGVETRLAQETQGDWGKIEGSKYCKEYKNWKKLPGREEYWEDEMTGGGVKEQWARLRCGNVGKAGNKGFEDVSCMLCGTKEENVMHIWNCEGADGVLDDKWVKGIQEWAGGKTGKAREDLVRKTLSGKPNPILTGDARAFER